MPPGAAQAEQTLVVALLNDSKYGHKIKGNVIDLNLLRSATYPGPRLVEDKDVLPGQPHHAYTDQGTHTFRYGLYPHAGNHIAGGVIRAGYEFNIPLRQVATPPQTGNNQPASGSFLILDEPNVIVEAIKRAEDSDAVIVRLYEAAHASARATLRFALPLGANAPRGIAPPSNRLTARDTDFSLSSLGRPSAMDAWFVEERLRKDLIARYHEVATRELSLGRYRRAAYIYAELLGDLTAAANALRRGRYYREAAVLYRDRLHSPTMAAAWVAHSASAWPRCRLKRSVPWSCWLTCHSLLRRC